MGDSHDSSDVGPQAFEFPDPIEASTGTKPTPAVRANFPPVEASAALAGDALDLRLHISDPEVLAELRALPDDASRTSLAGDALRLGVLALKGARRGIGGGASREESERLIVELAQNLELQQHESASQLTELLQRQIGGDDSALAETLAAHLGENSPFMQALDPKHADGLLSSLTDAVQQSLDAQREHILQELSLENDDSALAQLAKEVGNVREKLGESLEDEASPLSQLVQRVEFAQQQIFDEFSLDAGSSSLGQVRTELLAAMEGQKRAQREFQAEVRRALTGVTAESGAAPATRRTSDFTTELESFLRTQAARLGDIVERMGDRSGSVKGSKKGKFVVELGADCAASTAKVVVEVDPEASFTVAGALDELEEARENRGAQVGLYVFSREDYPDGLPPLERHGNDVVVVWDLSEPASDIFLEGALLVARALCVREHTSRKAELETLDALVLSALEIQRQAGGLDEIERLTASVRVNADKVLKRAMGMRETLTREFDVLQGRMEELRNRLSE